MSDTIKSIIELVLFTVITGCGVAVVKQLLGMINSKINELQANTKLAQYTQLNKYIDAAQDAITTAVTAVSQTYVDTLKGSNSFDSAAQSTAKEKATTIAKNLITEDSKSAINTVFGDFELFLDNTIETAVKNLK